MSAPRLPQAEQTKRGSRSDRWPFNDHEDAGHSFELPRAATIIISGACNVSLWPKADMTVLTLMSAFGGKADIRLSPTNVWL